MHSDGTGYETYRRRVLDKRRRVVDKLRRQQRIRIVQQPLDLLQVVARQQIGEVLRVVAAQQHGRALDNGLQVVQRVLAEQLLDAAEDVGQFREQAAAALRRARHDGVGLGVGICAGEGRGGQNEVLENAHFGR